MRNCYNCFSVDLREGMAFIEINQAAGENVENFYCHLAKLEVDWEIVLNEIMHKYIRIPSSELFKMDA